ncbi:MAG: bacterial transcriptional activator domain-containing protein [Acidimicrobiia bacterium]
MGAELVGLAHGHGSPTLPGSVSAAFIFSGAAWRLHSDRPRRTRPVTESVSIVELCSTWGESAPVEATVRALGEALDRAAKPVSAMPLAIHVADEVVEVFWDRPPPPPSATFRQAPTGWVWTASASRLAEHLTRPTDPSAPPLLPALVRAGATGLGELHLNLEACRLLNLIGDQPLVERALSHLVSGVDPLAVDLLAVGPTSELAELEQVQVVGADVAINEVRRRRARMRQYLEDRVGSSVLTARAGDPTAHHWRPLILIIATSDVGDLALEPIIRLVRGDGGGVSCVFVNRGPDGESLAVLCGDGVLHLPFLNGATAVLPDRAAPPPSCSESARPSGHGDDDRDPPRSTVVEPVQVRILGSVDIVGVSAPLGGKNTELVAYLACHPGGVSDERIKEALWPKRPVTHNTWLNRVSACRHTLGTGPDGELVLPHFVDGIGRLAPSMRTDVDALQAASSEAHGLPATEAIEVLRAALARVRGRPFDERAGYEWAFAEFHVAQAERIVTEVAHRLAELALESGDPAMARWAAEQGMVVVPASEPLAQNRMRAFAASGDLRGVDRTVRDLLASLGADDVAALQDDTRELHEQLCRPTPSSHGWR